MNIRETVKNVMSVVFEMPIDQIKDDSSPDNIGSWDSLKHINLALALEEEFDIEFTDEEIIELANMKLISIVIAERLKDESV
jgi:acyl carrier protein